MSAGHKAWFYYCKAPKGVDLPFFVIPVVQENAMQDLKAQIALLGGVAKQ